ncbi:MAG TPA: beta-propeller fold lactonase family protein, partial [Frankiaceae bacterium]|nr:beta-propeller fold lactonase family protein [Frankiaceae bacterium]
MSRETRAVGASGGRRWARRLAGLLGVLALGPIASMMWAGPAAAASPVFAPVPGSPFGDGGDPSAAEFSPSGKLLATVYGGDLVSVFSVGTDGALKQVTGSPFETSGGLDDPFSVAFSPSGGLLATANETSSVSVLSVGTGGALTPVAGSPFTTGGVNDPNSVAFGPSGGLLATANYLGNSVSVFSVGAGGALTAVTDSPFTTGSSSNPVSV